MRCRGNSDTGFHKMRMMRYYHTSAEGNYFACPECGRKVVVPHRKKGKIEKDTR